MLVASRQLGELEQRLGAPLNRSDRSFEPTAVGRCYYEGAREILAALAAFDEEAFADQSTSAIRITMAAEAPLDAAFAAAISTLLAARRPTQKWVTLGSADRRPVTAPVSHAHADPPTAA